MNDATIIQHALGLLQGEFGADLLGVLAAGSRLRGEGDAYSDIDLVVLIGQLRRRRWNIVLDGVEVEMFLNPLARMRQYLQEDHASGRGLMQHMLSTGHIIYDTQELLADLQQTAAAEWAAGPPPLSPAQQWQTRYAHADSLRDIADVLVFDPDRADYLLGALLPRIVDDHYRIQRRWCWKPKRVLLDLATWDEPAAALARHACRSSLAERFETMQALVSHVLAPLGGPMPLTWQSEWEDVEA